MVELYAIDKKGKIRVFKGEVLSSDNNSNIKTYTGLLGGNLIERDNIFNNSHGKQGRNHFQQARLEFESALNTKIDEGYKTYTDLVTKYQAAGGQLDAKLLLLSLDDIIRYFYNYLKIKFNTNKYWKPLPMLAEKWKDKKDKIKYPVLCQPKLNGSRCIALWNKEFNHVDLYSRGGQEIKMPHISSALSSWFNLNQLMQLDGELYLHGMPLQTINGIVALEDPDQFHRKLPIQYHIYDIANEGLTQRARAGLLKTYKEEGILFYFHNEIQCVKTVECIGEKAVEDWHRQFVADGYEGLMVRDPEAYYQFGFRDSCLIKMKEFEDEEFKLLGCEIDPSKGIESFVFVLENNMICDILEEGSNNPKTYRQGYRTFKARPTGTLEDKAIWAQNISKFIDKKVIVRYQERTIEELPHQGHVRHKDSPILLEAVTN